MTQALATGPFATPAGPAAGGVGASSGGSGAGGAPAASGRPGEMVVARDAVADAKDEWLQACGEGASSARVQQLYERYRALVIEQYAELVTERPSRAS